MQNLSRGSSQTETKFINFDESNIAAENTYLLSQTNEIRVSFLEENCDIFVLEGPIEEFDVVRMMLEYLKKPY